MGRYRVTFILKTDSDKESLVVQEEIKRRLDKHPGECEDVDVIKLPDQRMGGVRRN